MRASRSHLRRGVKNIRETLVVGGGHRSLHLLLLLQLFLFLLLSLPLLHLLLEVDSSLRLSLNLELFLSQADSLELLCIDFADGN